MMNVTWETFRLQPKLTDSLKSNGIQQPTDVQAETVPLLMSGRDVSARSQTGTGKTLAYMLPALQRIDTQSTALQVMVLAPTQELAMQIFRVAELYGEPLGVRTQQLIGGASMKRQVEKLRQHPHIVVGTPGRIHEIVTSGKLKLHRIEFVVIDEADQVFGLGSTSEVETLLKGMNRERQIAFFSATRPEVMEKIEERWMRDPQRIDSKGGFAVSGEVRHLYIVCDKRDKIDTARRIIRMLEPRSALLFINDTDEIANYESKFQYEGFSIETLYGDADKQRRSVTLDRFREGRCQLLLATDIAARGLDIVDLPLVLHLDPAKDADHYVHRSGRTGRMGKSGMVVSIITPQERFIMDKFRKTLGLDIQEKTMVRGKLADPEPGQRPAGRGASGPNARRGGKTVEAGQDGESGSSRVGGKPALPSVGGGRRAEPLDGTRRGAAERMAQPEAGEWRAAGERRTLAGEPQSLASERQAPGGARSSERQASEGARTSLTGKSQASGGARSSLTSERPSPTGERQASAGGKPGRINADGLLKGSGSRGTDKRRDGGREDKQSAGAVSARQSAPKAALKPKARESKRDRKDKGAPKWLKAKRDGKEE